MPRRGRECRSAGAESPECAKGLGSTGTPPYAGPDRGRPGAPAQAAPQGASRFTRARPSAFYSGHGCASCPLAQGLKAGQPPRPSRQAPVPAVPPLPAAALLQTPIAWSAPKGRRGEAPKCLLPSILRLSRMWYLQGW